MYRIYVYYNVCIQDKVKLSFMSSFHCYPQFTTTNISVCFFLLSFNLSSPPPEKLDCNISTLMNAINPLCILTLSQN